MLPNAMLCKSKRVCKTYNICFTITYRTLPVPAVLRTAVGLQLASAALRRTAAVVQHAFLQLAAAGIQLPVAVVRFVEVHLALVQPVEQLAALC
jgi:hypothetical protein